MTDPQPPNPEEPTTDELINRLYKENHKMKMYEFHDVARCLESLQAKVAELEAKKDEAYDALIKQGDQLRSFESNAAYKKSQEFANTTLKMYNTKHDECTDLESRIKELELKINTPETKDFIKGVQLEATHQRERWTEDHDKEKNDADWFWTLGYLAAKTIHKDCDDLDKFNHWIITCAALCANWHYYKNKDLDDKT